VKAFADFLGTAGIRHQFVVTPGAHTWTVWRQYLNELAPLLFKQSGKPGATPASPL
jgi:enterochelin esterase-like enzyme